MVTDSFSSTMNSLIAPARAAFAITPGDDVDLPEATKAIYVGTGGDLTVRMIDATDDLTFSNVASGTVLAIRLRAVRATATSAEDLVGLV